MKKCKISPATLARTAALALAQAGCRVTVCARTPEKAAALPAH